MPEAMCSIDGCERRGRISRGWCVAHYSRWRRHGDPTAGRSSPADDGAPDGFVAHAAAQTRSECIEWPYARNDLGYGRLFGRSGTMPATHAVLEASGQPRPAPPNDQALHSCDNPPCVNPTHLSWGSDADNTAEMIARGRSNRGVRNRAAKLTPGDVRAIRAARAGGESCVSIGERFGVADTTVSRIANRRTWKHV